MAQENCPRMALAERCKPKSAVLTNNSSNPESGATHVVFFGDKDFHREYLDKGYIPMKLNNEQVNDRGDLGYFIPVKAPVPFVRSKNKKATK